jgi:transposase
VSPRTVQSGRKRGRGRTGKGNPYLKVALGQMATGAAKTDTFLGARYRRLVKRMPKAKASTNPTVKEIPCENRRDFPASRQPGHRL